MRITIVLFSILVLVPAGCGSSDSSSSGGTPGLTIAGLPSGPTNVATRTLDAPTVTDAIGYDWFFSDGSSTTDSQSVGKTFPEGSTTVLLVVRHSDGTTTTATGTVIVDTVAPTVTVDALRIEGLLDEAATVTIGGTPDRDAQVNTYFLQDFTLDGGADPTSLPLDPGLGGGPQAYDLSVDATDPAGNNRNWAVALTIEP